MYTNGIPRVYQVQILKILSESKFMDFGWMVCCVGLVGWFWMGGVGWLNCYFFLLFSNEHASIFAKWMEGKWRWAKLEMTWQKGSGWHWKFTTFYSIFIKKRTVLTVVLAAWNALHHSLWNSGKSKCVMAFSSKSGCVLLAWPSSRHHNNISGSDFLCTN